MKIIEIKETELKEGEEALNYSDLLKLSVRQPKERGFELEEMRLKLKVLDKLEGVNVGDSIEFEDTEANIIKTSVGAMKWGGIHKDIVAFCDYINKI